MRRKAKFIDLLNQMNQTTILSVANSIFFLRTKNKEKRIITSKVCRIIPKFTFCYSFKKASTK